MKENLRLLLVLATVSAIIGCRVDSGPDSASAEAQPAATALTFKPSSEDDSRVVNTSMAALFIDADSQSYWTSGDTIVLRPMWGTEVRESFCDRFMQFASNPTDTDPDGSGLIALAEIAKEISPDDDYVVEAADPLDSLTLDDRIVLSEYSALRFTPENDLLKHEVPGKIRAEGFVSAPAYSKEGQYALLTMDARWGMHAAGATFLLARHGGEWDVVHVESWAWS